MPVRILTEVERQRWVRFPSQIAPEDVIRCFSLSAADIAEVAKQRREANRLGLAMQLCALRYLGFAPDDLTTAPYDVVSYVAQQLDVMPAVLEAYGHRAQTRTEHLQQVERYLGFRKVVASDLQAVEAWLVERALEHDKPILLLQLACEKLHRERLVRPGVTQLERLVATAREHAHQETFARLASLLTAEHTTRLDQLLVPDASRGRTPLAWLRQGATTNSPPAILETLDKLGCLQRWSVDAWDLTPLTPNRLKFLAQLARKATAHTLLRVPETRRHPMLVAFLAQALVDLTDAVVEMFDQCLANTDNRARQDLDEFRKTVARATNEKVWLFRELGRAVLDPTISDPELRTTIYQRIPPDVLQRAVDESDQIVRPLDDSYFDFLARRYGYLRQFAPTFLGVLTFRAHARPNPLLEAVDLLRRLNTEHRRAIPLDAPIAFVPPKWRPYVIDRQGLIDRHAYELCVLWVLRGALRAGDVWLESSRRYANPDTYVIPIDRWPVLRAEVCRQLQLPTEGTTRLAEHAAELAALLPQVEQLLARNGQVRMEHGHLVVSPLEAEDRPASVERLEQQIDARLPRVDLSDVLIEVDRWTRFSQHFTHAGGRTSRTTDRPRQLYASLLAQGCNISLTTMAQSAELSYDQLAWCTTWYLREDTLKAAVSALVNFHYHQPLSHHWGGGTLSSSDGQRVPVAGKIRNATALPRYFGYGKGVTFYTWTSDQFSQYGTKVIPATVRDATYVLDEILDNETELSMVEHTTDTAGYTELIFALFDLLGMQFAPRIRDLGDQRLYRLDRTQVYHHLVPRLQGTINQPLILRWWDELVRLAGSLKLGWVTASLLISKLQAYPRQSARIRALQEYGRLVKTIFILRYLASEAYRRRINTQLNKGEALHALRRFLFFADEGTIRRKQAEEQMHQAACLNLVTNAVVVWNTVYMQAVINQIEADGCRVEASDIAHLSPARYAHLNRYGKYHFDVQTELNRKGLRPLRKPEAMPTDLGIPATMLESGNGHAHGESSIPQQLNLAF